MIKWLQLRRNFYGQKSINSQISHDVVLPFRMTDITTEEKRKREKKKTDKR